MTSTIDELSRRKDSDENASRQEKMKTLMLGASNPLRAISKHFGLNYGDVLLYADSIRQKTYSNCRHELHATARLAEALGSRDSNSFATFELLVSLTQLKLGRVLDDDI